MCPITARRAAALAALLAAAACGGPGHASEAAASATAPETAAPAVQDTVYRAGDRVDISWSGGWYPGRITQVRGAEYRVTYDGYGAEWDEWVPAERLRPPTGERSDGGAAATAPPASPAPPAPAAPAAAPSAATLQTGRYGCYFNNYPYGLGRSSIQYVEILSPTRYREPRGSGAVAFDRAAGTLRMTSGPLAGRVAHLRAESNGNPKIVFERSENLVEGRPTIDISATHCYHGQD